MKYITAIYYPDGFGIGNTPSNRFASRVFKWKTLDKGIPEALKRLEISQGILGDDMIVFVDPRLNEDARSKDVYHQIKSAKLNVKDVYEPLPKQGFWLKKWHIAKQALAHFGDYVWMDFMDTIVKDKLNDQEIEFLRTKDICVEWESFRCFGEPPHFYNGRCATRRVKQPQTSIYYLKSPEIPRMALEQVGTDHDQISLAHVFEKKYGIFQDTAIERLMEFSSRGLFKVLPDTNKGVLTDNDNIYQPKIFHKCGY